MRLSTDYQGDPAAAWGDGPKPTQVSTEYQKQAFQYHGYGLADRLRRHVAAIEGVRHPTAAPGHHRAARDYVAAQLQGLGLVAELLPFRFRGRTHHNVRATLPGRDPRRPPLLLAAHYDSTPDTPGADDNASGVAALLECARLVAPRALPAGIEFVGFDLEELQAATYRVGSRRLARERRGRGEPLAGALILEMVGYRDRSVGAQIVPPFLGIDVPRTGDFLAAVGDRQSRALLDGFVCGARAAVPQLPIVPYRTRLRGWLLPLTRPSDNASFWDAGYAALVLTETAFPRDPHYHRRSDTSATLDFDFMAQATDAVPGAVLRLAGGD